MAGDAYEVLAIRYGTRETTKAECYLRYPSYGEPDGPLQMDYFFWILRNGATTILVDTGFAPEVGERRGRTCICEPLEALARVGVSPESVSTVILTHLHYDHTGNVAAFPDAELVVQQRELDFWAGPEASRLQFAAHVEPAEIEHVVDAHREGRVRCLQGSEEIARRRSRRSRRRPLARPAGDGRAGAEGNVILASDASTSTRSSSSTGPSTFSSTSARCTSPTRPERAREGAGAVLVPGHDPAVLERFQALEGEAAGLGVRVA